MHIQIAKSSANGLERVAARAQRPTCRALCLRPMRRKLRPSGANSTCSALARTCIVCNHIWPYNRNIIAKGNVHIGECNRMPHLCRDVINERDHCIAQRTNPVDPDSKHPATHRRNSCTIRRLTLEQQPSNIYNGRLLKTWTSINALMPQ